MPTVMELVAGVLKSGSAPKPPAAIPPQCGLTRPPEELTRLSDKRPERGLVTGRPLPPIEEPRETPASVTPVSLELGPSGSCNGQNKALGRGERCLRDDTVPSLPGTPQKLR